MSERLEKLQRLRDGRKAAQSALDELATVAAVLLLKPLELTADGTRELLRGEGSLRAGDSSVLAGGLRVMASLSVRLCGSELTSEDREELETAVLGAVNALRALDEVYG